MHPHVAALLNHPSIRRAIEMALKAKGTHGDTELVHVNPQEMALLKAHGGVGTRNPSTGLPQFYGSDVGGPETHDVGGPGNIGGGAGARNDAAARTGGGGFGGNGIGGNNVGDHGFGSAGWLYFPRPQPQIQQPQQQPQQPIYNTPPPPIPTTPMMSTTAGTDLTGGRFGALPSWATQSYQVGTAPTSYPTPGVNTADTTGMQSQPGGSGMQGQAGNGMQGQMGSGMQQQFGSGTQQQPQIWGQTAPVPKGMRGITPGALYQIHQRQTPGTPQYQWHQEMLQRLASMGYHF